MKIHEYQAKEIFRRYGIPVPKGRPAFQPDEAERVAEGLVKETGSETVVVKAQIHAGGRGKGGGVKVVKGARAAREVAQSLLGKKLVTVQTGPEGQTVRRLLVEQGLDIAKEYYVGMVIDREARRVALMASSEGGVEIEEVARTHPELIFTERIDPVVGLAGFQARSIAFGLGLSGPAVGKTVKLLQAMARLFVEEDASLVEVNPLVRTGSGDVVALDAKLNFDDNAAFRHKGREELRDPDEEDPTETEAKSVGLSYVSLKGNIGCLVNGAGLAMSTMDIIKHHGGEPANFLDVGGSASQEAVTKAMRIILTDSNVRGIFINIFGGIMKCDVIAGGVVAATRELGLQVPLVVRLEGTNVDKGRKILADSGLQITAATTMADGAHKIVSLVGGS